MPKKSQGISTKSILKPQKFYQPPLAKQPNPSPCFEDGTDYWAANLCFAVAAATLTLWPVANRGTRWIEPQTVGGQTGLEEFYAAPLATQQQYQYQQPITDDEVWVAPSVTFQPDEDYYVVTVQQQWPTPPPAFTDDDVPAGSLYAPPDELAWQPIASLQWPYLQPITDDVVIVPQPVVFQPDEDYWQQPSLWPQSIAQPIVSDEVIVSTFDEDYWLSGQVWPNYSSQIFNADEVIVPQPVGFSPDEDYWQNPTVPVQANLNRLTLWIYPQGVQQYIVDEDFWYQPMQIGTFWSYVPPQWQFETGDTSFPPPPPTTQNYVNWGTNNYVSQEIGGGVEF